MAELTGSAAVAAPDLACRHPSVPCVLCRSWIAAICGPARVFRMFRYLHRGLHPPPRETFFLSNRPAPPAAAPRRTTATPPAPPPPPPHLLLTMGGFNKFLRCVRKIGPKRRRSKARRSSGLPKASVLPEAPQDAFPFEGYVEPASSSAGTETDSSAGEPEAPDPEPASPSAASPQGMEPASADPEVPEGRPLEPASSAADPAFPFEGYVEPASSSAGTETDSSAGEPEAPDPEPTSSSAASPQGMEPASSSAASPKVLEGPPLEPASSSAGPQGEPASADPERQPVEPDSSAADPDGQIKPDVDPASAEPEEGPPGLAHVLSQALSATVALTNTVLGQYQTVRAEASMAMKACALLLQRFTTLSTDAECYQAKVVELEAKVVELEAKVIELATISDGLAVDLSSSQSELHQLRIQKDEETERLKLVILELNKTKADELSFNPFNNSVEDSGSEVPRSSGSPASVTPKRKVTDHWTAAEEKTLKTAVAKLSPEERKHISWVKILERGKNVFHSTRRPKDLKQKWLYMKKKERGAPKIKKTKGLPSKRRKV